MFHLDLIIFVSLEVRNIFCHFRLKMIHCSLLSIVKFILAMFQAFPFPRQLHDRLSCLQKLILFLGLRLIDELYVLQIRSHLPILCLDVATLPLRLPDPFVKPLDIIQTKHFIIQVYTDLFQIDLFF